MIREKGMFFGPFDADGKLPLTRTADMTYAAAQLLNEGWRIPLTSRFWYRKSSPSTTRRRSCRRP